MDGFHRKGEGVSRALEKVLDVPLYLAAQGMRLRKSLSEGRGWARAAQSRRALTKYLGQQTGQLGGFIGTDCC